ncbi:MAG: hypothetical protein QG645_722 [Patescibacteria group bacterium]|nr:hypothetical protein [Patescibacteria group bacterium]
MKKRLQYYWSEYRQQTLIATVAFFLLAGVLQYALGLTYVLSLTPVVIGILAALTVWFWDAPAKNRVYLAVTTIIIGMIVEIIGVNSGLIFGNYSYGPLLGLKIFGVPLLIGITWLLVTLSAWQIVSFSNLGKFAKIIVAAGLVVMFDLVLEQFATAYSLWAWQDAVIPLKNYSTWFVVGVVIVTLYEYFAKQKLPSIFGAAMLPLMALFFWLMLIV